jgi:predicted nucleic acid-binding protein
MQAYLDSCIIIYLVEEHLLYAHPTLKTPDAIHLATALYHGCAEFWTNDDRLAAIAPQIVKNVTN